jgi:prefoldin subunit 5
VAFDFLGIFSKQDLDNLRTFLQGELNKVDAQINHMVLEANKLQKTRLELLNQATRVNAKSKTFDNTFHRKVQNQVDDADAALLVQRVKQPFYQNIKVKDYYEHKIRKLMDEIEQLQEQVHLLRISKGEFRTDIETINSLFDTKHTFLTVEQEVT